MTGDREWYVEVQEQEGIARASRSDTHSDWSTTLGANYTYRLYLLTYNVPVMLSTYDAFVHLFTDDPEQFADAPSPLGTVGVTPELRT